MGKGWPPLTSLAPCKAPGTSLGKSRELRSPGLVRRCDRAVRVGGGWAWELLHVTMRELCRSVKFNSAKRYCPKATGSVLRVRGDA